MPLRSREESLVHEFDLGAASSAAQWGDAPEAVGAAAPAPVLATPPRGRRKSSRRASFPFRLFQKQRGVAR